MAQSAQIKAPKQDWPWEEHAQKIEKKQKKNEQIITEKESCFRARIQLHVEKEQENDWAESRNFLASICACWFARQGATLSCSFKTSRTNEGQATFCWTIFTHRNNCNSYTRPTNTQRFFSCVQTKKNPHRPSSIRGSKRNSVLLWRNRVLLWHHKWNVAFNFVWKHKGKQLIPSSAAFAPQFDQNRVNGEVCASRRALNAKWTGSKVRDKTSWRCHFIGFPAVSTFPLLRLDSRLFPL